MKPGSRRLTNLIGCFIINQIPTHFMLPTPPELPENPPQGQAKRKQAIPGASALRQALLYTFLALTPGDTPPQKMPEPASTAPVSTIVYTPETPIDTNTKAPESEQAHKPFLTVVPEDIKMSPKQFETLCKTFGKETEQKVKTLHEELIKNPRNRDTLLQEFFTERLNNLGKTHAEVRPFLQSRVQDLDMERAVNLLNTFIKPGGYAFLFITRGEYLIGFAPIESTDSIQIHDSKATATYPIYFLGKDSIPNEAFPDHIGATVDPLDNSILYFQPEEKRGELRKEELEKWNPQSPLNLSERDAEDKRLEVHHEATHLFLASRYSNLSSDANVKGYKIPVTLPLGDKTVTYKDPITNEMLTELASVGAELADLQEDLPSVQLHYADGKFINPRDPYHLVLLALLHYSIDSASPSALKEEVIADQASEKLDFDKFLKLIQNEPRGLAYRQEVGKKMYGLATTLLDRTNSFEFSAQ